MWLKYFEILSVYCVVVGYAHYHEFLYDYFAFKKVPNVIGFSCNTIDGDGSFLRRLNRVNIKVMLFKLNSESINRVAYADYHKVGIFINFDCYESRAVATALSEAAYYRLYDELHFWLIVCDNLENVLQVIDDRAFGISTDFIVAVSHHTLESYTLYDVYNPWKGGRGQLFINLLASWDSDKRLSYYLTESKIKRRRNLHGMMLTTAFFESKFKPDNVSLKEYLEKCEKNPTDGWAKFGYIVLQLVSEMFNFSLYIKEIAKWEKGDIVGPMSRALNNNDIDISGNPVRMAGSRLKMSKVVYPSWPLRSCFLFRSPQPDDVKFAEITRPFEIEVWYLIVFAALVNLIFLGIFLKYETVNETVTNCLSDSLLLILGAISLQSSTTNLKNISTRILFLIMLLFGYFINNYYSACIVSVRLDGAIFKVNDSLNELAKTGLKVASEPILFFDYFIKDNQWETKMFYTQRWTTTRENERFMWPEKGMQLVKAGSHAYHTYPDVAYPYANRFYTNREICELTEVNLVRLADNSMAVTYNSTLVELMKVGFSRLTEHGIRRRWLNRLKAEKPCCREDILSASSITMNEFVPHLVILATGSVFSVLVCAIEMRICAYKRKIKQVDWRQCFLGFLK